MAWSDIIGQHRTTEALRRAIETDRVAHAYLFHGPEGSGKRAAALEFARALQCERERAEACDECGACRKSARLVHPDVHVLFPYPSGTSMEDVAERLQRLAENPYEELDYTRRPSLVDASKTSNKQSLYPVSRINEELRRALSFRSHEGRYKVAVLINAEALRTEAANAFLKILEEPTPRTVFVLTAQRVDRLLPTIVSRCQRLRFDALSSEEIEQALTSRSEVSQAQAAILARMAGGSFTRATQLTDSESLLEHRKLVLEFFRYAYVDNTDRISDLSEHMAGLGREQLKGVLELMLQWTRDLLLYRTQGSADHLVNIDQVEAIARFCQNVPDARLEAMERILESARHLLERNVHTVLILMNLAARLRDAMHGDDSSTLDASLIKTSGTWALS